MRERNAVGVAGSGPACNRSIYRAKKNKRARYLTPQARPSFSISTSVCRRFADVQNAR